MNNNAVNRQNILNNSYALKVVEKSISLSGVQIQGEPHFTVEQVADFFEVTVRTIRRYLDLNKGELQKNGYRVLSPSEYSDALSENGLEVGSLPPKIGLFSIKSLLNLAMLLTESEKARTLRQLMLDTTIKTINERAGGDTKYINQRDEKYLYAAYRNETYNKRLHRALKECVTDKDDKAKYANYNDKIYKAIFKENSRIYKNILELSRSEKARDTMYSEVLVSISSIENAFAAELEEACRDKGRALSREEADAVFVKLCQSPFLEPQLDNARKIMASNDNALRNKEHAALKDYIYPIDEADYERFLGRKSKQLSERIGDNLEALNRLGDK